MSKTGRIVTFACSTCGGPGYRALGQVNRSRREGRPLFCSRTCFQATRAVDIADKQQRAKAYSQRYRAEHPVPAAYWQQWYAAHREQALSDSKRWYSQNKGHVSERGKSYRARTQFGEFAEAYQILLALEREIRRLLPDKYERLKARGVYDRYNERKKEKRNARRLNDAP